MYSRILNIISLVVILILVFLLLRGCSEKEQTEKLYLASMDSVKTFRDKEGLHNAQISVLEGSVNSFLKLVSAKDSTLRKLQAIVDKNTRSATILGTKTTNSGTTASTVSFTNHSISFSPNKESLDTLHECLHDTVYPTYSTKWETKWSKGEIVATKDSIYRKITFFNEFEIKQTLERDHFWQEKKSIIKVKSNNPDTETTELKIFTVGEKKPRKVFIFVAGVVTGFIVTTAGAIYLLK